MEGLHERGAPAADDEAAGVHKLDAGELLGRAVVVATRVQVLADVTAGEDGNAVDAADLAGYDRGGRAVLVQRLDLIDVQQVDESDGADHVEQAPGVDPVLAHLASHGPQSEQRRVRAAEVVGVRPVLGELAKALPGGQSIVGLGHVGVLMGGGGVTVEQQVLLAVGHVHRQVGTDEGDHRQDGVLFHLVGDRLVPGQSRGREVDMVVPGLALGDGRAAALLVDLAARGLPWDAERVVRHLDDLELRGEHPLKLELPDQVRGVPGRDPRSAGADATVVALVGLALVELLHALERLRVLHVEVAVAPLHEAEDLDGVLELEQLSHVLVLALGGRDAQLGLERHAARDLDLAAERALEGRLFVEPRHLLGELGDVRADLVDLLEQVGGYVPLLPLGLDLFHGGGHGGHRACQGIGKLFDLFTHGCCHLLWQQKDPRLRAL